MSFGYTLLHYEIFTIVESKGLHPYAAFLHSDKSKHPALCSDLMEEWRPILIDSLAIALLNNNKIKKILSIIKKMVECIWTRKGVKNLLQNLKKD